MRSVSGEKTAATQYALALYLVRALVLTKAAVLARLIGPEEYGVVAAFTTLLAYGTFLDIGLFNGQNREIPVLLGSGDNQAARNVGLVVKTAATLVALIAAAGLGAYAVIQYLGWAPGTWWFTAALAVALLVQQTAGCMNSLCYAEQRFVLQARALTVSAVVDVCLSIPSGMLWGARGILAVAPIVLATQWVVFRRSFGPMPRRFDFVLARRISAIGLPIALVWFAGTNLIGVDKIVIFAKLGTRELGLYSIAAVAGVLVTIGPNAIAQMRQPRILHRFGEEGHGPGSIAVVRDGQLIAGAVAGSLVAVGCGLASVAVATFLPAYAEAVPAAVVLMIASAVLSTIAPTIGYFIIHDRQLMLAGAYAAASLFNVGVDLAFIRAGFGLTGVAVGSLVTYLLLYVFVQWWFLRLAAEETTRRRYLRNYLAPALLTTYGAVLGAVAYSLARDASWLTAILVSAVAVAAIVPMVLLVARHTSTPVSEAT